MKIKYMLRRTLCPWKTRELVNETVAYCRKSRVDEIMWITESSGMYKELLPINEIKKLIPGLKYARKKTEAAGMIYSINPLTTIGHGEFGNELKEIHPDMDFMVDFSGKKSRACACPLSPYWRKLMVATYRLYAETRPAHLWIEDDFRYNNHGSVRFGCYCDLHLKEFAKRTGRKFSREALVALLLRPGNPAPERREWLNFLGDILSETAALIAKEVHAVSPDTRLGWMSVTPFAMDVCGTDINQMLRSFAGGKSAAIRMPTTCYREQNYRDLLFEDENLKRALPYLPENTARCTEIESIPSYLFAKSALTTAAQIEWACILNVPNQTMNIFDYLGSPMKLVPAFGKMLASRKKEFNSFAGVFGKTTAMQGVGIISTPLMSASVHTSEGKAFGELTAREYGWVTPLRAFGIPIVYGNNENITAVSGQALRVLDKNQIKSIFSRGVLLDGPALKVLCEMGYSRLAGAGVTGEEIAPLPSRALGPEKFIDPDFAGGKHVYSWTYDLWPEIILKLMPGAKMISQITDINGDYLFPAFVLFQNKLGGRVAVCPYNFGGSGLDPFNKRESAYFYSEYRQRQIQSIVRWLGRGKVPLVVEAEGWILPHRAEVPGKILLAAMNINADPWESVGMRVSTDKKVKKILRADIDGNWRPLNKKCWSQDRGQVSLRIKSTVPPLRTVAVQIIL